MANPVIGVTDWDDSVVTASGYAPNFPPSNLTRNGGSYFYKTPDVLSNHWLLWSAPRRKTFTTFVLAKHNATRYGGFRLRAANNSAGEIVTNPVKDTAYFGPCWWADAPRGYPGSGSVTNGTWTTPSFSVGCWFAPFHPYGQGALRRAGGTEQPTLCVSPLGYPQFKDTPNATRVLTGTRKLDARKWYYLEGSFDNATSTARLFVFDGNGFLEEVVLSGVTTWDVGTTLEVGPYVADSMAGEINEIRFFSAARTQSAVAADYKSRFVGTEGNLLGAWGGESPANGLLTNRKAGGGNLQLAPGNSTQFTYSSALFRTKLRPTLDRDHLLFDTGFFHDKVGITAQFVQIDLLDGTNPAGQLVAARGILSETLRWAHGPFIGSGFGGGRDPSIVTEGLFAGRAGMALQALPEWDKRWMTGDRDEAERLNRVWERAGWVRDIVAIADPDETRSASLGLVVGRLPQSFRIRQPQSLLWEATIQLEGT